jgi:mRNA interferase RelE/StbE
MQVRYHKQFEKDLERYASPEYMREIFSFIDALEWVVSIHDITNIKKLAGFKEFYRYRIGEYRLGFRLIGSIIQLDRFLHRKDIYKKYP